MTFATAEDFEGLSLDQRAPVIEIDTRAQNRAAATALVRLARHSVRIVSRHLDAPIYDQADFVDALRDLATGSRRASVQIIVRDSRPAMRARHRLVALAHRLASFVEIRRPAEEHARYNSALLLVDDAGSIVRRFADRYEAEVRFGDRRAIHPFVQRFDDMWSIAQPDPNVRRLAL